MNELTPEYYHDLMTSAGVGIIATDDQLVIQFCNLTAANYLNRPVEEIIGQPVQSLVHPERREPAQKRLEQCLNQREVVEFDYRFGQQDQRLHLAMTLSPIVHEARCLGVSIHMRNISRQVEMLRNISQAQKMAALESMAGAVAHHFNNILGGVITTVDFAQASDNPEMVRRALRTTVSALSRVSQLTFSLLAFAEGEHSDPLNADITETVTRYIDGLEPTLQSHEIKLEKQIDEVPGELPAKCILTVLDSLTSNAIEAMPDGGTLSILLRQNSPETAELRIADSGPGIPEEYLPRLFEPFFSTKSNYHYNLSEHAGLGLAMVHGIVCDLGGSVMVCNRDNQGAVCRIQLPLRSCKATDKKE